MKDSLSAAVYAKARSLSAKCLTASDYSALARCATIREAVRYLNATARYRDLFKEIQDAEIHRGFVEAMLRRDSAERYGRLLTFLRSGKNGVARFLVRRFEIEMLLNAYLFICRGVPEKIYTKIPFYMQKYVSFNLTELAEVRNIKSLLNVISGTRYAALFGKFFDKSGVGAKTGRTDETLSQSDIGIGDTEPDINLLTALLFDDFYEWALSAAERETGADSQLRRIIGSRVELENLLICYRMKKHFKSGYDEIAPNLMLAKRFLNDERRHMLDEKDDVKSASFFLKELTKGFAESDTEIDENDVEVAVRRRQLRYFRMTLRTSLDGVTALYALTKMLEAERQNVTTIIEAIRYGIASDDIERILV
ncbi:hypothetical protein FACS1894133_4940 [Clostridia bacterium]|nr:hypothetical protein FACS1894133_4940 [Clostridia bacterium]